MKFSKNIAKCCCRPKFGFPADQVNVMLDMLRRGGVRLHTVPAARVSPDPGDDKFIACALAAKADFLVTGNKRHFPESGLAAIRVVNAGELMEFIALEL